MDIRVFTVYFAAVVSSAIAALDVVILVDSSHYVGYTDWQLEATVISNAMYAMSSISPEQVRILGLVRYHSGTLTLQPFMDIQESTMEKISHKLIFNFPYITTESGANLAAGLRAAARVFSGCFNRENVPNLTVVVTSYSDSSWDDIVAAADELKAVSRVMTFAMDPREDKADSHVSPAEIDVIATDETYQQHYMHFQRTQALMQTIESATPDNSATSCSDCPTNYKTVEYTDNGKTVPGEDIKNQESDLALGDNSQRKDGDNDVIKMDGHSYVWTAPVAFKDTYIELETSNVAQVKVSIHRTDKSTKTWNMGYLPRKMSSNKSKQTTWNKLELDTESSTFYTVEKIVIMFKSLKPNTAFSYRNVIIRGCEMMQ